MSEKNALPLIETLIKDIAPLFKNEQPVLVGIDTGGYWVAEKIHQALNPSTLLGRLNISFYRDDFSESGLHPIVNPSDIAESLDDKTVILVDDVLQTGRTIRAAMNEIFDYGRPKKIILAVLIERTGRELPIHADFSALTMELSVNENVKLIGPSPITYHVISNEL